MHSECALHHVHLIARFAHVALAWSAIRAVQGRIVIQANLCFYKESFIMSRCLLRRRLPVQVLHGVVVTSNTVESSWKVYLWRCRQKSCKFRRCIFQGQLFFRGGGAMKALISHTHTNGHKCVLCKKPSNMNFCRAKIGAPKRLPLELPWWLPSVDNTDCFSSLARQMCQVSLIDLQVSEGRGKDKNVPSVVEV